MIRVTLYKRDNSPNYWLQFRHPVTGEKVRKSSGTPIRRQAEREAGRWQQELIDKGITSSQADTSWSRARSIFDENHLRGMAKTGRSRFLTALNSFETLMNPKTLGVISNSVVADYRRKMRDGGRAEATIDTNEVCVRGLLRWAVENKMLAAAPLKPRKRRHQGIKPERMKGRPISTEEFERILAKVPQCLASKRSRWNHHEASQELVQSWRFLLEGLFWSGLRLDEAMRLHWTDRNTISILGIDEKYPVFWIPDGEQKGGRSETAPMAPEFVQLLRQIRNRTGHVFNPLSRKHGERMATGETAGKVIREFGKSAGIKVREKDGKVKFASAHDFRRSFGTRWATRVSPAELQRIMRHSDLRITMAYYVHLDAETTSAAMWRSVETTSGSHSGHTAALSQAKPR